MQTCHSPFGLSYLALIATFFLVSCSDSSNTRQTVAWLDDSDSDDPRPDIVLVVSDDMRWDLMSARGHEYLETPHLDKLSSDGAMMLNAFVPVAVCSQSRAIILTGRDAHKASVPVMVRKNNSFLQTQKTFASYLQEAGYTTAFLGKWHLGDGSKPKEGFDHWESFDWLGDFHDPVIHRNGEPVAHQGYVDDILSRRAHEVLYQNREPGKPMFMMVSLKAPHMRFEHPERHAHAMENDVIPKPDTYDEDYSVSGKPQGIWDWLNIENHSGGLASFANSWQRFIKYHFRAVMGLDDQIGVLREAIKNGQKPDNTLFIFTSDNGHSLGDHGLSAKHFVYEEPIRVPFLVDPPGDSELGIKPTELVSTLDIAPTILDYANSNIPATMIGRSLRPLLTNSLSEDQWRDELFFMYEKERATVPTQIAVRTEKYKLIRSETNTIDYELYDLETDPQETTDLHDAPSYSDVKDRMHAKLKSRIQKNQWSTRRSFEVGSVLVSSPVSSAEAQDIARSLSMSTIGADTTTPTEYGALAWQVLNRNPGDSRDRLELKGNVDSTDDQSVLVVLPLERLVEWDPFVKLSINSRMHATAYVDGEFLYATQSERLPGKALNPPLVEPSAQVVIVFDDTGDMDVLINLEVAENTLKLPLENQILGDSPGRFFALDDWQPHKAVSLQLESGELGVNVSGEHAAIQTEAVYINQPIRVEVDAIADSAAVASLYWRTEVGEWRDTNSEVFGLGPTAGDTQVMQINAAEPIDSLQIRFAEEPGNVRFDRIEIFSTDGLSLYRWEFE